MTAGIRAAEPGARERWIYPALAGSLLVFLLTGVAVHLAVKDSAARDAMVEHSHLVRRQLALLLATHQDLVTGNRGYVISGNPAFLEPYNEARGNTDSVFHDLTALVQDNPVQTARLPELDALRREHVEWSEQLVELRQTRAAEATQLVIGGTGKRLMDQLRSAIGQMDAEETRLLLERAAQERASTVRLDWTLLASTGTALLLVIFAGAVIYGEFGRRRRAEQLVREQNQLLEQRVLERTGELREAEARLRTVFDSLAEGVAVSDLDGRLLDFNPAAVRMHGFSGPAEYLRHLPELADTFELSGPDGANWPVDQWPLARILRGEVLRELEVGIRRRHNGWQRVFSYGGSLARDAEGRPLLAIVTIRDITERKRSELRIRAQLEHLKLLDHITRATGERQDLKSIFQVVVRSLEDSLPIDFGCVCLYEDATNAVRVASVGIRTASLAHDLAMDENATIDVGANGLSRCMRGELVYEPELARMAFPFPQRLAHGGLGSMVLAPLRSESRVFGVLVAARRSADAFESIECEFLRQLSEHVALAAQQAQLYGSLQQAYDDLRQTQQVMMQEERLRALGQMASGIAHDINNALSPVSLYTEMMLETEPQLSDRGRASLETIRRAVGDVAQTVARMREFYRRREQQIELSPADVNQMIREVVELTRVRWTDMAQSRGVVIRTVTDLAAEPPKVMGVESEIREALVNLVFNAVDAMPDGGTLTLRSRLAAEGLPRSVVVEVTDTGVGMDEETRRRCLEPFYSTKGDRGTGLGLAMVYGMVQRHSADLEIDSVPGNGTTVRLVFAVPAVTEVDAAGTSDVVAAPTGLRLLLVDDDPVLLKSLRDALESDGQSVTTANGGEAGIAEFRASLARGAAYAAVFTDLGMPYVDGRRVAAAVKDAAPATPVIMMTGWGRRMVEEDEIPPFVDRVLAKPPKLREIREVLAQLCRAVPPEIAG